MMNFDLLPSLRNRKALIAASTCAALALVLTGCGLGTAAPAGRGLGESPTPGAALEGIAHGGQQGIAGATVQLWEAGGTSSASTTGANYGAGAIALINQTTNPVLTGFSSSTSAPTAVVISWSITADVATFQTGPQNLVAGQSVTLAGFAAGTFFNGQVVTVLSTGLSGSQFEANFTNANATGTESAATETLNPISVNSWSVASDIATFTTSPQNLVAGEPVSLSGFTNGTFFNGHNVTVLPGVTSTSFTAHFNNANTSGSETAAIETPAPAGTFVITGDYTCNSGGLVYLTVTGGNTGNTAGPSVSTNSAINLMAPLGLCTSLTSSTFINVNEVTTAAAAYALGNFYSSQNDIGAPSSNQIGLTNAFATVNNLVSTSTGAAKTTFTNSGGAGTTVSAVTVTGTPNAAKLYLLADIIASCVNSPSSTSANCTSLFTNVVTPPTGGITPPTPTDVMQAAVDMNMNPTAGGTTALGNLITLQTAQSPYNGSAASTANDLTLSVIYFPTASATSATGAPCVSAGSNFFMYYNFLLAVDANGNIWASSNKSGTAGANVSEISPTGAPLACVGASAFGGTIAGLTIDTSGNIWASDSAAAGGPIEEINPTALTMTSWGESGVTPSIGGLVADGSGNVFYSSSGAALHEFVGAASASVSAASTTVGQALATNSAGYYLAADPTGRIWSAEIGGTNLYETYLGGTSPVGGYSTASVATTVNPQSQIAVDSSNKIWYVNSTGTNGNNIAAITPNAANGSAATATVTTAAAVGGLAAGRGAGIDGAGNVWVPNSTAASVVVEVSNAGNALSPSTGFVLPTNSTLRSPAIDPSGNVWIGTNATMVSNITEIVGAAVPTVTPISAAIAAGKLGAKP